MKQYFNFLQGMQPRDPKQFKMTYLLDVLKLQFAICCKKLGQIKKKIPETDSTGNAGETQEGFMKLMHRDTGLIANKIADLLQIRYLISFQTSCILILFIRVKYQNDLAKFEQSRKTKETFDNISLSKDRD